MLIALAGRMGSGKDTVADMLVEKYGFVRDSFAGTLKDAVAVIFGWDREMLEGKTKESRAKREEVDLWWADKLNIPHLTPRWVMQNFGTDVMRTHFHPDIWVASLERKLISMVDKDIVISDARFINEVTMLANIGAKTASVFRGVTPDWWKLATMAHYDTDAMNSMLKLDIHRSEWDWAGYNFEVQIDNNGTLEELQEKVESLVRL